MMILKKKVLERNFYRKLREESTLTERRNVFKNVRLFLDKFSKRNKTINHIAAYWPLKNEVDVRGLKDQFTLALPRCEKDRNLFFYSWDDKPLTKDLEGIPSPNSTNPLSSKQISLILIPCLAVDQNLIRLGSGGGYFDKLRGNKNWSDVPCIGLLTSNCLSNLPLTRANWDIPLSGFITEREISV
jgi:5,10-methenyltetrahydrofolate synthetase